ncbi:MAG: LytTR family DNA-binding domain-containing protein [Lactobacillales bacterium]|jgi:DNA-binding LytR/AlgR family response regulator|nr:LytTR family DNA-binding domain-containing protein [Lactobacillales bacterium]
MANIQAIIIDDDNHTIDELQNLLSFFHFVTLQKSFNNFLEAREFLNSQQIDLVFLDILLEKENGIEIAELMQKKYPDTFIIFITSQPEFALESYKVSPIDFLTKPINSIRLENNLIRVKDKIRKEKLFDIEDVRISIRTNSSIRLVEIKKIKHIQKQLRKISIKLTDDSIIYCNETIKALEKKLHPYGFIALNRTNLIPIQTISKITYNKYSKKYSVLMKDDSIINDISKEKYRILKQFLSEFSWII